MTTATGDLEVSHQLEHFPGSARRQAVENHTVGWDGRLSPLRECLPLPQKGARSCIFARLVRTTFGPVCPGLAGGSDRFERCPRRR